MTSLEYLKTLPVLWINVDTSVARAERFRRDVVPYFANDHRISARPITDARAEAQAHSDHAAWTREHADPRGLFSSSEFYRTKFRDVDAAGIVNPSKVDTYSKTRSLILTAMLGLEHGLELGYERWMMCEDDAVPRIFEMPYLPTPPQDAQIRVWGGAYPHAGPVVDNAAFLAGRPFEWMPIRGKDRREYAHAYEVTREGAAAMAAALRGHYMNMDNSWWYAFDAVPSVALYPGAFVQIGQSERNVKIRTGRQGVALMSDVNDFLRRYPKWYIAEEARLRAAVRDGSITPDRLRRQLREEAS